MDTMQMLGYDKQEVLYESNKTLVCRAKNKAGKVYLIKTFKEEQPTVEQLARLEYEYVYLKEQNIAGVPRVCELIKNYKGHLMVMEDEDGIPIMNAPIFKKIYQGEKTLIKEDLQWILQIFIEMVTIIGDLHERHLIHREINPSVFLFLPESGKVNMVDLGMGTEGTHFGSEQNHDQILESVLPYISPEQTGRIGRTLDYRTDFYSLGVSMYELITGQKPFLTTNPMELVYCHIAEKPYPPYQLNRNIPVMVSYIIMKLLEKVPEQRYQSEAGIIHDLRKCLEQLLASDDIGHFELGEQDSFELYGRSVEKERVKQVNRQVANGAVRLKDIDMMSIVNVSRAVSKEEQLPDLLRQIMKTVIENSGAQNGYIFLESEQGWIMEAEKHLGTEEIEVLQSIPLEEGGDFLPNSIFNFCIRTKEYLVLGDASKAERYSYDPYIRKNQIKSLLCMPIMNRGSLVGILYLENNLSPDVFTKERVNILQLLAAQFAVSIKNVQLFRNLLAKTEEVHQATEEVLRSDIAFLQAQIKPHFLYNAINTISAFSLDDAKMARDLLAKLSQYLRGSFDFKNRDKLVTLRKELELVEAYLFIEQARFGERLKVVYNIDENVDGILPPLVIQPLVENAVHHGLSGHKKGGTVEIGVHNENNQMVITVEDDGIGMDDDAYAALFEESNSESSGIALKNIQMRMLQLYGHGLEIERKSAGGTKVTIRIKK